VTTEQQAKGGDEPALAELMRRLPQILEALPEREATAERVLAELTDMQVAHEELRVAEEEMRVQQDQITQLLVQHETERRWRGQMSALVPIGLCATDGNGSLMDANPAFASHLGTALHRLRGKPLSVFLGSEDMRQFRAALRALASGAATEERLTVTVRPRHLPPETARLFGFVETADHRATAARIQWVLVPEGSGVQAPVISTPVGTPGEPDDEQPIPAGEVIGLASSLAQLSSLPVGDLDQQRLLSRMAVLVRGAVPAADWVSITIGSPLEPQRLGSDSLEAQEFDGRQVRAGQGPCWNAYDTGAVVLADDVTTDARWPALAQIAGQGDVRSVLALPVRDDGTTTGVVNVYSGGIAAFGTADRRIGELATAAVAGVLQNVAERESMRELAANLERALTSRAVIDQAKGVVMARLGVDADQAFARLVKLSSRMNVKLRDLAALVVEGHADAALRAAE
jgi:GAF domain-containing protein